MEGAMATPVSARPSSKQYLGNTNHLEVHDLNAETDNCQINEIIQAGHAVVFSPDTLIQAHSEEYDNCKWCLGSSTR
jgi:hypothetical protein